MAAKPVSSSITTAVVDGVRLYEARVLLLSPTAANRAKATTFVFRTLETALRSLLRDSSRFLYVHTRRLHNDVLRYFASHPTKLQAHAMLVWLYHRCRYGESPQNGETSAEPDLAG